ncbi:MAG: hypothetical protein FWC89_02640 [Defluviitaleaceae bacterium]|nr:hypothetical protein [Defluviitaleaceae bacterium]
MIKIIRENKLEVLLLLISLLTAIIATAGFFLAYGQNLHLFLIMLGSWVWLYLKFRAFMKILAKYEWENPVTAKIRKFLGALVGKLFGFLGNQFARLARKIKELASKLPRVPLPALRKSNRLTLFHDEKIRVFTHKKRDPFRKMKWKNLQSHRERVRFIYVSFLQQKIKKGAIVKPSDTPNELSVTLNANEDPTTQLFSLYNIARYSHDKTAIAEEEVEYILPCASRRLKL